MVGGPSATLGRRPGGVPQARAALDSGVVPSYLRAALGDLLDEITVLKAKADTLRDELERPAEQMPEPRSS